MHKFPQDPLQGISLETYGRRLRAGKVTAEAATRTYLERIAALDPVLGAFEHVSEDSALGSARAMDQLLAAGVDLGPLMGVPVTVKDLVTVRGMPLTAGSRVDISDLIDPDEGPLVDALRRSGCILLGKTRMVEFALGITGISAPRGTPWNPWDADTHRVPGGSSSGAAVATAAGLCALSVGSDTGGSVRVPAALCGIFGLKTSHGHWPLAGTFPLASHLDSLGLLTRSADDALLAYRAITRLLHPAAAACPEDRPVRQLRLGRPRNYFHEDLHTEVAEATAAAEQALAEAGARLKAITVARASEREAYFPVVQPVSLLATLGRERFQANRSLMDPVIARRVASGLDARAVEHVALEARRERSCALAASEFVGLDAWVSPTVTRTAPSVDELADPDAGLAAALGMTRNTQPGNYFDLCGASLPVPMGASPLPVGYQVMCPNGHDARLLTICCAIERVFGKPALPNVQRFARH